jgi:hypothetical protein
MLSDLTPMESTVIENALKVYRQMVLAQARKTTNGTDQQRHLLEIADTAFQLKLEATEQRCGQ